MVAAAAVATAHVAAPTAAITAVACEANVRRGELQCTAESLKNICNKGSFIFTNIRVNTIALFDGTTSRSTPQYACRVLKTSATVAFLCS